MTVFEEHTHRAIQCLSEKAKEFTLRDYLAGQALAGMGEFLIQNKDDLQEIAKTCYNVADAMIEFRKEKK